MAAPSTGIACPSYPWPQDASQRGPKVFMQSDCAACHSMLPYAGLRETAAAHGDLVAQAAEIVVVTAAQEAQPAATRPLHGGAPDLTGLATKVQDGLRWNLYSAGGGAITTTAKMAPPTSVWLQFAQPYLPEGFPGSLIDPALSIEEVQDGLRWNLCSAGSSAITTTAAYQELKRKMAPPSSVWLQFAQPYLRAFQAA